MEAILKVKTNVLKKMLGKKVFVITNHLLNEGFCGTVTKIVDHENVIVSTEKIDHKVNIFDIRTPSRLYNCE